MSESTNESGTPKTDEYNVSFDVWFNSNAQATEAEEFLMICQNTDLKAALLAADRPERGDVDQQPVPAGGAEQAD